MQDILLNYKDDLNKILKAQLSQITKSFQDIVQKFEYEIQSLIEVKVQRLIKLQADFQEDYEEHLANLKETFTEEIVQMGQEMNASIRQSLESNTLTSKFNKCLKEIKNDNNTFDLYKFKFFNCLQPEKIQPLEESISQIYVLNQSLSAFVFQNSQAIQVVDNDRHQIVNKIHTPFIKKIISSNPTASTLSYKTDREIFIVNYLSKRIVRMFVVNNTTDEMICACQLSKFVFAYATNFGRIWIVDITTGEIITKLDGEIPSILFKFNNKFLIAAGISRGIFVWDWRKNIVVQRFIGHNSRVNSVIKYDDDHIISCDQSGKIFMFRLSTSTRCKQFIGHEKSVVKLIKFNKEFIVSCSFDRSIRFWNVESENCFRKLENHGNFVLDIAKFGKNKMYSTCLDKFLNVWG